MAQHQVPAIAELLLEILSDEALTRVAHDLEVADELTPGDLRTRAYLLCRLVEQHGLFKKARFPVALWRERPHRLDDIAERFRSVLEPAEQEVLLATVRALASPEEVLARAEAFAGAARTEPVVDAINALLDAFDPWVEARAPLDLTGHCDVAARTATDARILDRSGEMRAIDRRLESELRGFLVDRARPGLRAVARTHAVDERGARRALLGAGGLLYPDIQKLLGRLPADAPVSAVVQRVEADLAVALGLDGLLADLLRTEFFAEARVGLLVAEIFDHAADPPPAQARRGMVESAIEACIQAVLLPRLRVWLDFPGFVAGTLGPSVTAWTGRFESMRRGVAEGRAADQGVTRETERIERSLHEAIAALERSTREAMAKLEQEVAARREETQRLAKSVADERWRRRRAEVLGALAGLCVLVAVAGAWARIEWIGAEARAADASAVAALKGLNNGTEAVDELKAAIRAQTASVSGTQGASGAPAAQGAEQGADQ
jgi:hypothetical protein